MLSMISMVRSSIKHSLLVVIALLATAFFGIRYASALDYSTHLFGAFEVLFTVFLSVYILLYLANFAVNFVLYFADKHAKRDH